MGGRQVGEGNGGGGRWGEAGRRRQVGEGGKGLLHRCRKAAAIGHPYPLCCRGELARPLYSPPPGLPRDRPGPVSSAHSLTAHCRPEGCGASRPAGTAWRHSLPRGQRKQRKGTEPNCLLSGEAWELRWWKASWSLGCRAGSADAAVFGMQRSGASGGKSGRGERAPPPGLGPGMAAWLRKGQTASSRAHSLPQRQALVSTCPRLPLRRRAAG